MKEFAISETAKIKLKAMVSPILYAVSTPKQLEFEYSNGDPCPVVESIFADLLTATRHSVK